MSRNEWAGLAAVVAIYLIVVYCPGCNQPAGAPSGPDAEIEALDSPKQTAVYAGWERERTGER